MPFQPINFASIDPLGKPWARDFAKNIQEGMNMYNLPQKLMGEREQMAFNNALMNQKVQQGQAEAPFNAQNAQSNAAIQANTARFAPQMSEADIRLKQGHATQYENMAKLPYGGNITGDLMQSIMAHKIINDPNAPTELKEQVKRDRDALIRQRLMGNTPMSAKLREDEERIWNDPKIPYEQKQELIDLNRAANVKGSVIPELEVQRTRAEITSEGFDKLLEPKMLDALTSYSGLEGMKKRTADEWEKFSTGRAPERLLMYEDALATAESVSMNLRAAIKESVSPAKGKEILDMISPQSLMRNKEQAIRRVKAAAAFFDEIEKKQINKSTGRGSSNKGGAHNETIRAVNENAKKTNYAGKTRNLNLETGKYS